MAPKDRQSLDFAALIVAVLAMIIGGWGVVEAHWARVEAKAAIAAAERSANAAEKGNSLVARGQTSYLLPAINRNGNEAVVSVKNVSANVALNISAGYFLYSGPLTDVRQVANRFSSLPLRSIQLALAASGKIDVFDILIPSGGGNPKEIDTKISVPVVKSNPNSFLRLPTVTLETQVVKTFVQVPSRTLVIGLVSFEDTLNIRHRATFCFPVDRAIQDEECAKLNSLQLEASVKTPAE